MPGTVKALYVLLIKFPQVFPISPFYVKRNRNSERVNQMWNLCLLPQMLIWTKVPRTMAVAQRQWSARNVWGVIWGMVKLELWHWWVAWDSSQTQVFCHFFFLSWEAVRSPWRIYAQMNSGIHGKWILKAGVMSPSYSASTSQAVDRLAKLCTLTPWGMDLISSDSNATWIQSFPKPKPAPDIDGCLGIDLLGLTPWD